MSILQSIFACSTITNKVINRDACATFENRNLNLNGIIVADGIGNSIGVEIFSRFIVENIKKKLENIFSFEEFDITNIISNSVNTENLDDQFCFENNSLSTTIIVAFEYEINNTRKIKIGYLGNGSIWHIKGNFAHFNQNQLFPWSAINYLNPHTNQVDGQEKLYSFLHCDPRKSSKVPTVIELSCDLSFGDIIMISSDGIYSIDQQRNVEDSYGNVWIELGLRMLPFYRMLNNFLNTLEFDNSALENWIATYLQYLKHEDLIDDDATIGMLLLPTTLNHYMYNKIGTDNTNI
jgi:PPM family protein phosphatase